MSGPIGRGFLLVGVVAALFGALASITAARTGDKNVSKLIPRFAVLLVVAAAGAFAAMEHAMITRDFSLAYVQKVGSWSTPSLYNFAAVWSALEGSILMWVVILAGYTGAVAFWVRKHREDTLSQVALAVMFIVALFFFILSFGPANPFVEGPPGVLDGPGPNPLLQNHILVMFHPPLLYLGYVGMTVPFAFAIAALVTGRLGEGWLLATRRWTLFAFG
ncbi:MAG: heme lyase CcmF/NrfE family subunit, partial [Actinobacteria bacterium]|nr:heme lyase CcmF/NrfE family subunit [Actinomycetota bacterium]